VAELADALDSKSSTRKGVKVRSLSPALPRQCGLRGKLIKNCKDSISHHHAPKRINSHFFCQRIVNRENHGLVVLGRSTQRPCSVKDGSRAARKHANNIRLSATNAASNGFVESVLWFAKIAVQPVSVDHVSSRIEGANLRPVRPTVKLCITNGGLCIQIPQATKRQGLRN
jgi:hypothetical protein